MLQLTIVTVIAIASFIIIRIDENDQDRKWKECEETDWNEYYANI